MPTIDVATTIDAPQQRIYDVITDLEHAAEHITGIDRVELLTDPPFGPGTRWIETRTLFGREAREEMTIETVDPPRGYTVSAASHGAEYHTELSVRPLTGLSETPRCEVRMTFTSRAVTLAAKLTAPLFSLLTKKTLVRCLEEDLADIKRRCETPDAG